MAAMAAERQLTGTAFALRDPIPWPDFAGLVREGEKLGYRAVFLPEIAGRDAIAALMGLAGETQQLMLGTGIVPMMSRQVRLTAMGAATVQDRSGGRMVLGLGPGAVVKGALERLAAQMAELRAMLAGPFGEGLSLRVDEPVPLWISALGPKAVALAGRLADGVLLNWCTPARVAEARAQIRRAAEDAGRNPDDVTIAVYIRSSVGVDPAAALAALKRAFGEYASYASYARQFAGMGMAQDAEAAAALFRAGRPDDIPDELVGGICLIGDTDAARERVAAYREAGADLPVVYAAMLPDDPVGSLRATLRALAPRPRFSGGGCHERSRSYDL
jgi:alkanesulfonate monooxygenase SsuD/methylene tetrahydromethanopterin reductase-like flavin-dependent oxidoreductase (luciferase family)